MLKAITYKCPFICNKKKIVWGSTLCLTSSTKQMNEANKFKLQTYNTVFIKPIAEHASGKPYFPENY